MKKIITSLTLIGSMLLSGCTLEMVPNQTEDKGNSAKNSEVATTITETTLVETTETTPTSPTSPLTGIMYDDVMAVINSKEPAVTLNNGNPYFTDDEISIEAYESYADLDDLGRCGVAMACLSSELQPAEGESRESISSIKPSGWQSIEAPDVDGGWLYNRCHLIGWQLAGENANPKNLITGTRQLNIDGMLAQENAIDQALEQYPGIHIMYRVTPIYMGDELVARGVVMEALSVEDNGSLISFCFWCPNTQEGWTIDYATGNAVNDAEAGADDYWDNAWKDEYQTYIINTKSKKFHLPDGCNGLPSEENSELVEDTYNNLISQGYSPCGNCFK